MFRHPAILSLLLSTLTVSASGQSKVDFVKDVRPIFQAACNECHGEKKPKGKLRLDSKALAMKGGNAGVAIVPGKGRDSYLMKRIRGDGGEDRMPLDHDPLTPAQAALIEKWIDEGATWPDSASAATAKIEAHWAYVKPMRPHLPTVKNAPWIRTPIDAFVLARLEKEGLTPSPEADRATLIRRVSLDLIGLPPSPAEVDAFVRDESPGAYEALVDRLLASPHYGEKWARHWLDLARYADTNGYEKDRPRNIWPWRDWVINALNADMPFDRFTVEQIAGDLLLNATPSQRIATGFHRNTMLNEEGGIDMEEFRFKAIVDRVQTTATTWLGQTMQCAQCHNHKYDPFSQKEYYSFFGMLNNADDVEYPIPDPTIAARRAEASAKIAKLEADRATKVDVATKVAEWESKMRPTAKRWTTTRPVALASKYHATMEVLADGSVLVSGDKPNYDTYTVELAGDLGGVRSIRLEVLPDPSCPENGPGRAPLFAPGDFLLSEFRAEAVGAALKFAGASHSFAEKGKSAAACLDGKLDTGWSIRGHTGDASWAVFNFAEPLPAGTAQLKLTLIQQYIHQMTIGRFRLALTRDDGAAATQELPPDVEAALVTAAPQRTDAQHAAIERQVLATAPELAAANKKIAELRRAMPKLVETMVFEERRPQFARVTKRHHRGEFLDEREELPPGVPAVLHPLPKDVKADRLALARWLVDENNPLVGRVVINRYWATIFGRGIVNTVGDFGVQGEKPSHPELLDWLATEFVRQKWSVKAMHRMMVTSATYRQSSRVSPELWSKDPQNVLLARGPRFRVEAETVRDVALSAAGLLNDRIGGPSVYPPQPAGVAELSYGATPWPTSKGPDRFRRGLYTYLQRTSLYPGLTTFDAPTSETTCPLRPRSNTPLQALQVMNDRVFVEAAQGLARRVMSEAKDGDARLKLAFRLCLSREATPDELGSARAFYDRQLARFTSGELKAEAFAASEAMPKPPGVDLNELAAWTAVGRALLNLDETITKE